MKVRMIISPKRTPKGLTLIEITIALLILALMFYIAIPGLAGLTRANLKTAARELAGTIRYLFNYSVTKNLYCRLVIYIEEGSYSAECSEEQFLMSREKEEAYDGARAEEEEEEEDTFGLTEEEKEILRIRKHKVQFSQIDDADIKPTKLPNGVGFDGVWVMHQPERYTRGKTYIYFFPSGFMEKAVIHLVDESGVIFSVVTEPITGKAKVYNRLYEIEE